MKTTTIYLLHFDRPLAHARHYLGSTSNLEQRIDEHRKGVGHCPRLIRALHNAGIGFEVVATWAGDKNAERKMKGKSLVRYCPLCKAEYLSAQRIASAKRREATK